MTTARKKKAGLDTLLGLVRDDLQKVNALILDYMRSDVALIPQLAGHLIGAGGKRLRPLLTLAASQLCGYQGTRHLGLAACIEFIHTATLLHDDVIDDSDLRRGQTTANAVFGNKPSVLVGDFLFSRSFQLMSADGSLEVIATLAKASAIIAEGEVQQLMIQNDIETTLDSYLSVINSKTAALFSAATRLGAIVAERPEQEKDALAHYGQHVGIAFQLVDDVLDYSARQAELGKTIGDDFREGKMTLPVLICLQKSDADERQFWQRTLGDLDQHDGDLDRALALMTKHATLADSMNMARDYARRAIADLDQFPHSPARTALIDAAEFSVSRDF